MEKGGHKWTHLASGLPYAVAPSLLARWQQAKEERGFRAYGVLIGSPGHGGGVLASFCDHVLDLSRASDDADALTTIFSV